MQHFMDHVQMFVCFLFFFRLSPHQESPLHWAAGGDHVDTVLFLVENGADVNVKDNEWVSERDCTNDSGLELLIRG